MFRRVLARWLTVEGFEFWGAVSTRAMNSSVDHVIVMLSPTETLRNTRLGLSVDGKEHQRPWHDHSHGERAGKLKLPAVHRMGAAQVALPLTRPTSTPSARACPFCIGRVLLLSDERCTFSNNASKDCKPLPVPCLYENVFRLALFDPALYASGLPEG